MGNLSFFVTASLNKSERWGENRRGKNGEGKKKKEEKRLISLFKLEINMKQEEKEVLTCLLFRFACFYKENYCKKGERFLGFYSLKAR